MMRILYALLCFLCILLGVREHTKTATILNAALQGCKPSDTSIANDGPTTATPSVVDAANVDDDENCRCYLPLNNEYKAQSGQDQYLFQRVFFPEGGLCCRGVFVEFGARDGQTHSNTYMYERNLGWKGLLFEVDHHEYQELVQNRPLSDVVLGPVCPSKMQNVTIILSTIPGFTGTSDTYEPTRNQEKNVRDTQVYQCHHLATELKARNMHRVDYMTIDTEGSELEIILDFPWNDFDIRVVQIEQLLESVFPSQAGRQQAITQHLQNFGYHLLSQYPVGGGSTTIDLIFVRNVESMLKKTAASNKPSRIWPHEPKANVLGKPAIQR